MRDVYEVPSMGRIALVEAFKEEDIGRLVQNTNLQLPSERDTCTVAEWEVRDDIQLDEEKLRFALQYTFGNHSVGRSCCDVCGLKWYKGMRSATYVLLKMVVPLMKTALHHNFRDLLWTILSCLGSTN